MLSRVTAKNVGDIFFETYCILDQRKILLWKTALNCDDKVIRILAVMHKCSIGLILSKHCIGPTVC